MNNQPVHLNSCAVVKGGYIFNFQKKAADLNFRNFLDPFNLRVFFSGGWLKTPQIGAA